MLKVSSYPLTGQEDSITQNISDCCKKTVGQSENFEPEVLAQKIIFMAKQNRMLQVNLLEEEQQRLRATLKEINEKAHSDPFYSSIIEQLSSLDKKTMLEALAQMQERIPNNPSEEELSNIERKDLANRYLQISTIGCFLENQVAFLAVDKALKYEPNNPHILIHHGNLYLNINKFEKADSIYDKVLNLEEPFSDLESKAIAYKNLGKIHALHKEWASAENHYREALTIYEQINDLERQAEQHSNIGKIHYVYREWEPAEMAYNKALKIYQDLNYKEKIAQQYDNIGDIYQFNGGRIMAEQYYRKARTIYNEIGDKEGKSFIEHKLSKLYYNRGNHEKALFYAVESLNYYEAIGNPDKVKELRDWVDFLEDEYGI